MNVPKYIVIHCTDVSWNKLRDQFKQVNAYHRDEREFPRSSLGYYVGYHRLITGGKNYQARVDNELGAHCNQIVEGKSMNVQSLGICVGFDGDIEMPNPEDYALLKAQVLEWQDKYSIPPAKIFFHRHFAKEKTCPGSLLKEDWLKKLLERPAPPAPEPEPVKPPEQKEKQEAIEARITFVQKLVELLGWIIGK